MTPSNLAVAGALFAHIVSVGGHLTAQEPKSP